MRYSNLAVGLLYLASIVDGRPTSHVEPFEKLREVPEGWKEVGEPDQDRRLHFRIAVHQVGSTQDIGIAPWICALKLPTTGTQCRC